MASAHGDSNLVMHGSMIGVYSMGFVLTLVKALQSRNNQWKPMLQCKSGKLSVRPVGNW